MSSYVVLILGAGATVLVLAVCFRYFFLRETRNLPMDREDIERLSPQTQESLVIAIFKISLIQAAGMIIGLLALVTFYVCRNNADAKQMLAAMIAGATIYLLLEINRAKRL